MTALLVVAGYLLVSVVVALVLGKALGKAAPAQRIEVPDSPAALDGVA